MIGKLKKIWNPASWGMKFRSIKWSRKFGNHPKKIFIHKDVIFQNPQHIFWRENCFILQRAAFCPLHQHNGKVYPSIINIGSNVHIGAYDRIASAYSVTIEDDVLFAAFVHVTDHSHGYENVDIPIHKQDIITKGPVVIKKGSWIAFGCHILSGVTIGEHCVVAANSVVTKDIPPYSVAAGNPAKVIKRYNKNTQKWERV